MGAQRAGPCTVCACRARDWCSSRSTGSAPSACWACAPRGARQTPAGRPSRSRPSGRKPPSVAIIWMFGCDLARDPWVWMQPTIPTASVGSPVSARTRSPFRQARWRRAPRAVPDRCAVPVERSRLRRRFSRRHQRSSRQASRARVPAGLRSSCRRDRGTPDRGPAGRGVRMCVRLASRADTFVTT